MKENKIIFAIDPGNICSGYVIWNGAKILEFGKIPNEELLEKVFYYASTQSNYKFIIENVASYGMSVGQEVFSTCIWIGRYFQKIIDNTVFVHKPFLVFRREVKLHLCGSNRAKDTNIIQALKDRFEPDLQPKKRPIGILRGLTKDCWQAFALAVTYYDQNN